MESEAQLHESTIRYVRKNDMETYLHAVALLHHVKKSQHVDI